MPNVNRKKYLIFEQDDGVQFVYQVWRHKEGLATWVRGEAPISYEPSDELRRRRTSIAYVNENDTEPRHAKSLVKFMERNGYTTKRVNQRELEQYLFMEGLSHL